MNKNNYPTFPIAKSADDVDDIGDDFDDLDDLHFMTSIDQDVKQDATVNYQGASNNNNNNNNNRRGVVETFEIDDDASSFQPVGGNISNDNPAVVENSSGNNTSTTNATARASATNLFASISSATSTRTNAILHTVSETRVGRMLKNSTHPGVAIFHVLFKILALFTYIFGGWFAGASNFVTITVICIILLACDFWVVKNVSGRLLVGLRWWNKVEEDGSTRWIFESAEHAYTNSFDKMTFWGVTYVTPAIWVLLFIVGILKLHFGWLIVVVVALTLSFSNVYGYWKCSTDQKSKLSLMISTGAQMGMSSAIEHNVFGRMANAAASRGSSTTQSQQQQRHGG